MSTDIRFSKKISQPFSGNDTPFDLPFLELSAFQVTLHHTLVQLLSEFIKKIGAAVILVAFHVHIDVVAVLDFYTKDFGKGICQFFYTDFTIVDTVTGIKCVEYSTKSVALPVQRSFSVGLTGKVERSPCIRIFNNFNSVSMTHSSSDTFFSLSVHQKHRLQSL